MTQLTLPQGFTSRPATMDDIPACVEMFELWAHDAIGRSELDEDEVRNEWKSPDIDLARDIRIVFAPNGTLAGYVEVWAGTDIPVRPWIWARVHPDYQNLGLGVALTKWGEQHAHRALEIVPEEYRVAAEIGTHSNVPAAQELIKNLGYSHVRSFYTMRIQMDAPPPLAQFPESICLKQVDVESDLEAVYRADQDAFRDHYGFVEEKFENGFARFRHHFLETENYDPTLWFIAWDGDEIAGINICRPHANDDNSVGYVSSLGVRRAWRKRGLGLALLQHSFGEFYRRGKKTVDLGVDADSLTGALHLYKKAGMSIFSQFDKYEKELRAGKEISVQSIKED